MRHAPWKLAPLSVCPGHQPFLSRAGHPTSNGENEGKRHPFIPSCMEHAWRIPSPEPHPNARLGALQTIGATFAIHTNPYRLSTMAISIPTSLVRKKKRTTRGSIIIWYIASKSCSMHGFLHIPHKKYLVCPALHGRMFSQGTRGLFYYSSSSDQTIRASDICVCVLMMRRRFHHLPTNMEIVEGQSKPKSGSTTAST